MKGRTARSLISPERTALVLAAIRRIGVPWAIFGVSVMLSLLSVSIASVTHALTGDPIGYTGLINTALIPFILGVPTLIVLLSVLVELEQTQAELKRLSTTDVLTGLLNRRSLLETGQKLCAAAGAPRIALALVDADLFKDINDRHGHLVGDATLRALAACLRAELPDSACCGRYGGEEFAIVLPGASADEALELAERARSAVAEQCRVIDGVEVAATISVGVAISSDHGADLGALLSAADQALYEAKRQGRDQVVRAVPEQAG